MPSNEEIIEKVLDELATHLLQSDQEVTSTMAETNATGYLPDEFVVTDSEMSDGGSNLSFDAKILFTGDAIPDKPFAGDEVSVELSGKAILEGGEWTVSDYTVENCKSNL